MLVEEAQIAGLVGGVSFSRNSRRNSRESTRTDRKKPWPARDPGRSLSSPVRSETAAAGYDHVDVGVVCHRRAPGMEHGGDADLGAEMLGIGGDGEHGLGSWP